MLLYIILKENRQFESVKNERRKNGKEIKTTKRSRKIYD